MKRGLFWSSVLVISLSISGCKREESNPAIVPTPGPASPSVNTQNSQLIFNTGFESPTSMVAISAQIAEFRGTDATVSKPNDWSTDFNAHPNIGSFRIYYEQGDSSQRLAAIVPDPVNVTNKVLSFTIKTPHIEVPPSSQYTVGGILFNKKARVQAELYGNNGLKEIYQSIKLFVPADFNKLINSPFPGAGDWITLFEFWNNEWWSGNAAFPFRFGINIDKGSATIGSPLYFKAEAQKNEAGKFVQVWYRKNMDFAVPIGKWMTLEYYIKEGNKGNGRFYFAVTPDGGAKTVVFDINGDTAHPDDPSPNGLSEINPIKFYSSNNIVNQMNALGGTFQLYWDDFKFWKDKKP
ncbi:hypothetical protein ACX0G7_12785 [Flavitalea antarctica]